MMTGSKTKLDSKLKTTYHPQSDHYKNVFALQNQIKNRLIG